MPSSLSSSQTTEVDDDAVQIIRSVEVLTQRIANLPRGVGRRMVAVAGAPASGKTTFAHSLTEALVNAGHSACTIPMDGYHLDNTVLENRGLLARKGAPETFDSAGFIDFMQRVRKGGEVYFPLFDRTRDLAVAGAALIEKDCDVAIVEGNYLLFDESPWSVLAQLWDLSVWFEVSEDTVFDRCLQRWLAHGHALDAAKARAGGNDLTNARRIMRSRLPSDVIVTG